jgi:hypothetical protein
MRCRLAALIVMAGCWCSLSVAAPPAEISAEQTKEGAVVKIDGQVFAAYLIRSGSKPILWPINGPGGKPMTRPYPMVPQPGETKDHIHHRSLWFTHGSVNGIDFWTEEGSRRGTIRHRQFVKVLGGRPAVIVTRNDWLGPDGKKQCEDRRTLSFDATADARWIDFDIVLTATDGPVKFGDTKEGTFGVRVPDSMCVDAKRGGRIVNSRGQTDAAAWGQPAAWVDYHGPVDGQTLGIAILNHPSSLRFPTTWHVRTYGLFAANPFGARDFSGNKKADGSYTIPAGGSASFRYRVILHRGDEKVADIAGAFARYAKEAKSASREQDR